MGNKIRNFFKFVFNWLDDHTLTICSICGRLVLYKNITLVVHRLNGRTELCQQCYQRIYLPYSSKEEPHE